MRCLTSSTASSTSQNRRLWQLRSHKPRSSINTDTPGRVDKAQALQALQASGQSYDAARETLKHVQVDASGKLELEDWVEVRRVCFKPCTLSLKWSLLCS